MDKAELKRILEEHKIWLCSDSNKGQRANLVAANLKGADLKGVDLTHAKLQGANLQGANLQGANLFDADLYNINLRGANLEGANLDCVDLEGGLLEGAKFSIEIRESRTFIFASVSKEQLPWLALHPQFAEYLPYLRIK